MPTITSGGASNQWDDQQGEPEAATPAPDAAPAAQDAAAVQADESQPGPQDAPTPQADAASEPSGPDASAPDVEEAAQTVTPPPPPPLNPEGA